MIEEVVEYDKLKDNLFITLTGKYDRMGCSKNIVRILGCPNYICVRINKTYSSIALRPCEQGDPMSFKVPESLFVRHDCKFRINSKAFVREVLSVNGYEPTLSYKFKSYYAPKYNTVVIPLDEGELIEGDKYEEDGV